MNLVDPVLSVAGSEGTEGVDHHETVTVAWLPGKLQQKFTQGTEEEAGNLQVQGCGHSLLFQEGVNPRAKSNAAPEEFRLFGAGLDAIIRMTDDDRVGCILRSMTGLDQ